jgi:protein-disulfide isomerase
VSAGLMPVTAADPRSGAADALVTVVIFGDFQCPFCGRAAGTMGQVRQRYTDSDLRIVWKNHPLPFHTQARPAAEVGQAVFEARGSEAFWRYHDAVFANQRTLETPDLERAAEAAGVSADEVNRILDRGSPRAKIDQDEALAKKVGSLGTPSFFVNGTLLSGARPLEDFTAAIDKALAEARAALAGGVPRASLYATLSDPAVQLEIDRHGEAARAVAAPRPPADTTTVHLVPIAGAPTVGPANAVVTIVEYADFQCPFCRKSQTTLADLKARHPNDVRFVWKNKPLAFHKLAEPAAELAMEAFAQRGNAGFWKVHDALFDAIGQNPQITEAELVQLTTRLGFGAAKMRSAISTKKHHVQIEREGSESEKLDANGTPTFFINGRRLVGAQPLEKFEAIVEEEIARGRGLVARGIPASKVYEEIQKTAVPPKP